MYTKNPSSEKHHIVPYATITIMMFKLAAGKIVALEKTERMQQDNQPESAAIRPPTEERSCHFCKRLAYLVKDYEFKAKWEPRRQGNSQSSG